MRTIVLVLGFVVFGGNAFGASQAIFGKDRGIIVIQGPSGDVDAATLWNLLTVTPAESPGGYLKKAVNVSIGNPAKNILSIICTLSKTVANLGSCTVIVQASSYATIDKNAQQIVFTVEGDLAPQIGANFVNGTNNPLFLANDGHFTIRETKDHSGLVNSFTLEFRD